VAIKEITHDFPTDGFFMVDEPSRMWLERFSAPPATARMGVRPAPIMTSTEGVSSAKGGDAALLINTNPSFDAPT
jgi:hypothetical protein